MIKKIMHLNLLILFFILAISCEKVNDKNKPDTESLIFPIGMSSAQSNSYTLGMQDLDYEPHIISDSNNGYWLEFPRNEMEKIQSLTIQFTRSTQELVLQNEEKDFSKWLSPSFYIDNDNSSIKSKADELTNNLNSNYDKAKRIQQYVVGHVKLNINLKYSFYHKASTTLDIKEGTCINFSRLFVALCRAANVPAQTIWGVIYGYSPDVNYNFHHQWAEILDESNNWRVLDLTYTTSFDLNNIRYLDLIYGPEENNFIRDRNKKEIMLVSLKYFNDYPVTTSGRLDFRLTKQKFPDTLATKYVYEYEKLHFND